MSDLWTEASRDIDAETLNMAVTSARVGVQPVWEFLAGATTDADFEHRKAIIAEHLDAAVDTAVGERTDLSDQVRTAVLVALDSEFTQIKAQRLAAREPEARARIEAALREAEGGDTPFVSEADRLSAEALDTEGPAHKGTDDDYHRGYGEGYGANQGKKDAINEYGQHSRSQHPYHRGWTDGYNDFETMSSDNLRSHMNEHHGGGHREAAADSPMPTGKDSIFCGRCKGTGMVNMGGAVRNCTKCKGSGLKPGPRKTVQDAVGREGSLHEAAIPVGPLHSGDGPRDTARKAQEWMHANRGVEPSGWKETTQGEHRRMEHPSGYRMRVYPQVGGWAARVETGSHDATLHTALTLGDLEERPYEATCPNPSCPNHGTSFVHDDFSSTNENDDDEAVCPDCETPLVWENRKSSTLHTAPGGGEHAPYRIEPEDKGASGPFKVVNDLGEVKSTFDSWEKAREYQKALYANVPGASESAEKEHKASLLDLATAAVAQAIHIEGRENPSCPRCGSKAVMYSKFPLDSMDGHTSHCRACNLLFNQEHAYAPGSYDKDNPTERKRASLEAEAAEEHWLDKARRISSGEGKGIYSERIDHVTAGMLTQVHDALSPENQAKFKAMPLHKAVDVGWKVVNRSKKGAYNPFNDQNNPYVNPKKPTPEELRWRQQFPEGVPLHGDLTPEQERELKRRGSLAEAPRHTVGTVAHEAPEPHGAHDDSGKHGDGSPGGPPQEGQPPAAPGEQPPPDQPPAGGGELQVGSQVTVHFVMPDGTKGECPATVQSADANQATLTYENGTFSVTKQGEGWADTQGATFTFDAGGEDKPKEEGNDGGDKQKPPWAKDSPAKPSDPKKEGATRKEIGDRATQRAVEVAQDRTRRNHNRDIEELEEEERQRRARGERPRQWNEVGQYASSLQVTAVPDGDKSFCRICGRELEAQDNIWYALKASPPKRDVPKHYCLPARMSGANWPGEFNAEGELVPGTPKDGGIYDAGANLIHVSARADQHGIELFKTQAMNHAKRQGHDMGPWESRHYDAQPDFGEEAHSYHHARCNKCGAHLELNWRESGSGNSYSGSATNKCSTKRSSLHVATDPEDAADYAHETAQYAEAAHKAYAEYLADCRADATVPDPYPVWEERWADEGAIAHNPFESALEFEADYDDQEWDGHEAASITNPYTQGGNPYSTGSPPSRSGPPSSGQGQDQNAYMTPEPTTTPMTTKPRSAPGGSGQAPPPMPSQPRTNPNGGSQVSQGFASLQTEGYGYAGDPHWITAQHPGVCASGDCHNEIKPGDRVFFYPHGRKAYCAEHSDSIARRAESEMWDEDVNQSAHVM